jgi:hypothetical protein
LIPAFSPVGELELSVDEPQTNFTVLSAVIMSQSYFPVSSNMSDFGGMLGFTVSTITENVEENGDADGPSHPLTRQ